MRLRTCIAAFLTAASAAGVLAVTTAAGAATTVRPADDRNRLVPGDLVVNESYYTSDPNIVAGQTVLPPGCVTGCVTAIAGGNYPYVFNNATADAGFGVTSRLYLREITPSGRTENIIPVPDSELNTSFSSKSEGALNLSADGKYVTFMDYVAKPDTVDVSNANTPGVVDPTNPVPGAYYRASGPRSPRVSRTPATTPSVSGSPTPTRCMSRTRARATAPTRTAPTARPPRRPRPACRNGSTTRSRASGSSPTPCRRA